MMSNTVPLYRYYNPKIFDHFCTTNDREIDTVTAGEHGYAFEGPPNNFYLPTPLHAQPLLIVTDVCIWELFSARGEAHEGGHGGVPDHFHMSGLWQRLLSLQFLNAGSLIFS